jgi:hypothetical protein
MIAVLVHTINIAVPVVIAVPVWNHYHRRRRRATTAVRVSRAIVRPVHAVPVAAIDRVTTTAVIGNDANHPVGIAANNNNTKAVARAVVAIIPLDANPIRVKRNENAIGIGRRRPRRRREVLFLCGLVFLVVAISGYVSFYYFLWWLCKPGRRRRRMFGNQNDLVFFVVAQNGGPGVVVVSGWW